MASPSTSISGLVGAALGLLMITTATGNPVMTGFYLGSGVALLVRSVRPPLRFGRGLATWVGGGFAGQAVAGLWLLVSVVLPGRAGAFGGVETAILIVVGSLLGYLLLRVGFKPVQISKKEDAEKLLEEAIRMENRGELQEAREAYQKIVSEYGDTPIAADALSCLEVLDGKTAHPGEGPN